MLPMKQLNSNKTHFPRFDKILVIMPLQRCMVWVTNDNSAQKLGLDTFTYLYASAKGPAWPSVWLVIQGSWVRAALDPLGFFVGVSLGNTFQSPS